MSHVLPIMGLKRDNRYRQRMGKLLELTKPQQIARQDWQANRPIDWADKMIYTPGMPDVTKDGVMSWGFCRVFDYEKNKFTHHDMPGSIRVAPVAGKTQVVRTDTTDRLARMSMSVKRIKGLMHGD